MKRILAGMVLTAAMGFGQPNVTAWDVLKKGLAETNPDKRKQAVLALSTIGPAPEVIDLLNESLRDKEIIVRQTAAAAIGENKIRGCMPNLRAALDDVGEVAFTAAKALWDLGDRNGTQVLEDTYTGQSKKEPGMIESAVRDAKSKMRDPKKLAMIGVNEASGALLGPFSMGITMAQEALKDGGAPGRALAITTLAQECSPRAVELMYWSLGADHNALVQAATAKAIGKCGDQDAVEKLMPLLVENNVAVRYMAAGAVVRLSIGKAVPQSGK